MPPSPPSARPPVRIPEPPPGWVVAPPPAPPEVACELEGTRLWLARHAQVTEDGHTIAYGNRDVPLSEEGVRQTKELCAAFEGATLRGVRSSDLSRARALGECLARRTGAPLVLDPRLREIDRGEWTGLQRSEFARRWAAEREAWYADPWNWRGHGGESDRTLLERVESAVLEAAHGAAGATVALACHYNVMRVLLTSWLGLSTVQGFAQPIDLARATLLEARSGRWHVVAANVLGPPPESA